MTKLDASGLQQSKPLVYLAAQLQRRQIARQACRKQFDDEEDDALDPAQQELFPGLQTRYPAAHSDQEEPSYVVRDAMGAKDVAFNVRRLRWEERTKLGRADALEMIGPMPGTVIRRAHAGSCSTKLVMSVDKPSMRSSSRRQSPARSVLLDRFFRT